MDAAQKKWERKRAEAEAAAAEAAAQVGPAPPSPAPAAADPHTLSGSAPLILLERRPYQAAPHPEALMPNNTRP